ncbi:hypothetical protein [Fluviispira vulneris]|nr:hypothetical protein [Fluviispira vulneris]
MSTKKRPCPQHMSTPTIGSGIGLTRATELSTNVAQPSLSILP